MQHKREWEPTILRENDFWRYTQYMEERNTLTHEDIRSELFGLVGDRDLSEVCIIMPGSDGKFERHEQSKHELIVISNQQEAQAQQFADELFSQLQAQPIGQHFDWAYRGGIEAKALPDASPLSFVEKNPQLVFPDRIINAVPLLGSEDIFHQARIQTIQEALSPTKTGKDIRERLKEQQRQASKVTESGYSRGVLQFDRNSGTQFYNETAPGMLGFKTGPQRLVHRKLDRLTLQLAGQSPNLDALTRGMPTNTVRRIDFLVDQGLIDPQLAIQVQQAYTWFLLQYHSVQEVYKNSGTISNSRPTAALQFDTQQFDAMVNVLIQFSHVS